MNSSGEPQLPLTNLNEYVYPTLVKRIQSICIDNLFIITCLLLFSKILENIQDTPDWFRAVLFFAIFTVYEPLLICLGGTLGNRVMKIQVRKSDDEANGINILQAYLRFIFKVLFGWLSFITIHMNPQKRAIHDLISGTVMIQK
jgi:uncharacterized RDD family membrane protein YckC